MPQLSPVVNVDYVVLFTDKNLAVLGDPIICWRTIDVTLRWNEPSTSLVEVPAYPWIVEQMGPGNRMIVIRDGEVLIAGPVEDWLLEKADNGENAGDGRLTVIGADDLALVVAKETYPDPALSVPDQTTDNWAFTGNSELALRDLVNLNAGPGALTARRVPQLALGALASVGTTVEVFAQRNQPLGDVARAIALSGGDLGFRTRQVASQILFEVYASPDLSGTVRFGFGLGNLRYLSYQVKAPTATAVSVGGQGTGASALMIERVNSGEQTAWGRFEKHVPRDGSGDVDVLEDEGDRALAEGAATTRVATNVSDLPDQRFGVHYGLGDVVSVETLPGQQLTEKVRTVHLQAHANSGEYVAATVGSQAATTDPDWLKRLRDIDARLGRVETVAQPA